MIEALQNFHQRLIRCTTNTQPFFDTGKNIMFYIDFDAAKSIIALMLEVRKGDLNATIEVEFEHREC